MFLVLFIINMVFFFELLYELCLYLFSVGVENLLVEEFPDDGLELHFLGNSIRRSVSWMKKVLWGRLSLSTFVRCHSLTSS